jgi:hypothetical protein
LLTAKQIYIHLLREIEASTRGLEMASKAGLKAFGAIVLLLGVTGFSSLPAHNPAQPAPLCAVSPSEFKSWKSPASKTLSFVAPNSASFTPHGNCSFYKWSSQMFLWLTSRNTSGNLEMFSPTFYNAIESTTTGGFQLVRNHEALGASSVSKVVFMVRVNKPKLLRFHAARLGDSNSTGQAGGGVLLVNGQPVPVSGKSGYATYPVVYYAIEVNDVFAGLQANQSSVPYYNSGSSQGDFPTTLKQAQQIQKAAGTTYSDLNQLALEVKSAWVDTAYLTSAQAGGLVTISAQVPAFTQSTASNGNLVLTWDGTTMVTRTLALVGLHATGSLAGHPELMWATVESNFNSPDNTYSYLNGNYNSLTKKCPKNKSCLTTVNLSAGTSVPTIFYNGPSGASSPPNSIVETASSGNNNTTITSTSAQLTPTDVVRMNPWGNQQPATPTVGDPIVLNNTELLSLKTSLQPQLASAGGAGPTLANYFLVGGLWSNGIIPPISGSVQIGSLYLANTTMETFQQVSPQNHDPNATAQNCFSCHGDFTNSNNQLNPGTSVSHVFPNVTGLSKK